MEIKAKPSKGLMKEFEIKIKRENIDLLVDQKLSELSEKANLPGFRPGKVPISILKKQRDVESEEKVKRTKKSTRHPNELNATEGKPRNDSGDLAQKMHLEPKLIEKKKEEPVGELKKNEKKNSLNPKEDKVNPLTVQLKDKEAKLHDLLTKEVLVN